jgi:acyl-CoA thioesterase-1
MQAARGASTVRDMILAERLARSAGRALSARRALSAGLVLAAGLALLLACDGSRPPATPRALPGEAPSRVAGVPDERGHDAPVVPADAPLVVFLGDSLAAGLHLAPDEAFPAVLQRELAAAGRPFRLVNAGTSGDTTAGGLRRVDWLLKQRPDVLVVELGGNDGLRGQELASIEANLRAIVTQGRAAGARVVLCGMDVPTSLGADYAQGFRAIYPRVAAELGAEFVPGFLDGVGGVPDMNLEDGLHPTAAGHERLARNALPVLRDVLESLAAR